MKCILCNSRKAKRYCPAKGGSICPVCCGEKRGILFDYRSDNPIANDLADRIIKVVREEKDSVQITYTRISLDYARDVLQEFLNEVEFFMKNDINPQGYLIHILRYHPEVTEARKDRGRLIISP